MTAMLARGLSSLQAAFNRSINKGKLFYELGSRYTAQGVALVQAFKVLAGFAGGVTGGFARRDSCCLSGKHLQKGFQQVAAGFFEPATWILVL
jgi:hypothetical protein